MLHRAFLLTALLALPACSGCGGKARLPVSAGTGPQPALPPPRNSLIPLVNVVTAKGWPAGATPLAAEGTPVAAFAGDLDHPRWLYVLPNGDVLVAETNAPPRPEDGKGIKGWFFKRYQKKAGGAVPSANRITLLRDADGDGVAETRTVFLDGPQLAVRHGARRRRPSTSRTPTPSCASRYEPGATQIAAPGHARSSTCPAARCNHHWTKNVIASADGSKLYATVGSNSNVAENGMDEGGGPRGDLGDRSRRRGATASSPPGCATRSAWPGSPTTRRAVDGGQRARRARQRPRARLHDVGARRRLLRLAVQLLRPARRHARRSRRGPTSSRRRSCPTTRSVRTRRRSASPASRGTALPARFAHGMFVGPARLLEPQAAQRLQGDLRAVRGRRVPAGEPLDVLTGFVDEKGDAMGRPVGVAIDRRGALLVADDVGNVVWRVSAAAP